jgi:uncharacterized repeat protein (TIGR03803 family)
MESLFGRSALRSFVAAAILAGCGGSQPPIGAMPQTTTERTRARPAYSVLYSFKGGSGDGETPYAGLVNVNGTLYGTTGYGGGSGCYSGQGCGTVFSVTRSGTEHVLYSFGGYPYDAASPYAGLTNVNGTLYGTTRDGGGSGCYCGTVFSVTRSGKEHVLYSFKRGNDGKNPVAGLIDVNGTLYSTTTSGGAYGYGTVFSITMSGKETVLHSFGASGDGADPFAGLINVDGTLYGTTYGGGANGYGTVYAISP